MFIVIIISTKSTPSQTSNGRGRVLQHTRSRVRVTRRGSRQGRVPIIPTRHHLTPSVSDCYAPTRSPLGIVRDEARTSLGALNRTWQSDAQRSRNNACRSFVGIAYDSHRQPEGRTHRQTKRAPSHRWRRNPSQDIQISPLLPPSPVVDSRCQIGSPRQELRQWGSSSASSWESLSASVSSWPSPTRRTRDPSAEASWYAFFSLVSSGNQAGTVWVIFCIHQMN